MKFTRERFQNGSLRRVPRKTGPDVWEFRFRDHTKPGLPMRQMTLSTLEYPTETAARRALQEELLRINGSEAYIAQRSPTFGTVLDKFIADERLKEIKAFRPGDIVDEGLKYSTTTGYLSVIKQHLRPKWGEVQLTDIKPLAVQEWLRQLDLSRKTKQNIKAVFHRMVELAMLWELTPAQRNPLSLVEIKGGSSRPRRKKSIPRDHQRALFKVEVGPLQCQNFTHPQAKTHRNHHHGPERLVETFTDLLELLGRDDTEACHSPPVFGLGKTQPSSLAGHWAFQAKRISAKAGWRGISSSL